MAAPKGPGLLRRLEGAFGLPELSAVRDTLKEVNHLVDRLDEKRLGAIRHLVADVLKLQKEGGPEGLKMFVQVVTVIAQLPESKVDKVSKVVEDIRETSGTVHKILQMLPPEMLKGADIMAMVKEAMAEK